MKEALKLALEALENHSGNYKLSDAECVKHDSAITAIKEALAQDSKRPIESDYISQVAYTRALEAYCDGLAEPEQEPVAITTGVYGGRFTYVTNKPHVILPDGMGLYAAPQRPSRSDMTWVEVEQVKWEGDKLLAKLKEHT